MDVRFGNYKESWVPNNWWFWTVVLGKTLENPLNFREIYHIRNKSPVHVRCMRQGAQGWCTGMTQRDGMGWEMGGGFRMGNTCTSMVDACWCMAKPIQYCKVNNNNYNNQSILKKISPDSSLEGLMLKLLALWPLDAKNWLTGKDPDTGKDWRREEKRLPEDEMVGWHH